MVILVAIWALQKASDRFSAITRARLQGERGREGDGGQTAISLSSPVSLSQWILKASFTPDKWWVPQFFFLRVAGMQCERSRLKKTTPSLLPALNFTSSALSQSMCTLLVCSGACCLNVTTRSLYARCIRNSASSSPLLPPFLSFLSLFFKYPT